jgi:hypothetical protein
VPDHPAGDGSVTAIRCRICAAPLTGRADRRFCSPACRQAAHRRRTTPATAPAALAASGTQRQHSIYECDDCGQRLAGIQWCPDCQRPCRRIDYGGACPSCGDPITITELTEAPMP